MMMNVCDFIDKIKYLYPDDNICIAQPGDTSHLEADDEIITRLIEEEKGRESFTAVVIQSVSSAHISYLKHHVPVWTRQLA